VEKQTYTTPELKVHGSVEDLTLLQDKDTGPTDGFTFQGVPIANVS
jgi:hypothetical protein